MADRPVVLYIAASLDGYIADAAGGVGWLEEIAGGGDYGYTDFLAGVDTLIMGRTTYAQVLTFGDWPYPGKQVFVLSRTRQGSDDRVEFVDGDITAFVRALKARDGMAIWLVGGAQVIRVFLQERLLDQLIITIVPVLLGEGIPLFMDHYPRRGLALSGLRQWGDIVQWHYAVN